MGCSRLLVLSAFRRRFLHFFIDRRHRSITQFPDPLPEFQMLNDQPHKHHVAKLGKRDSWRVQAYVSHPPHFTFVPHRRMCPATLSTRAQLQRRAYINDLQSATCVCHRRYHAQLHAPFARGSQRLHLLRTLCGHEDHLILAKRLFRGYH